MDNVAILLVGRSAVTRQGVSLLLQHTPGVRVVGEAGSTAEALELVAHSHPDVVVAGALPPVDPAELAARIAAELGLRTPVLVLTSSTDPILITRALRAGAAGYLSLADTDGETLVYAIHACGRGLTVLGPPARGLVDEALAATPPLHLKPALLARLTQREQAVLRLLVAGRGNQEIADRLGIRPRTVETHITRILDKLGATSRAQAIALALQGSDTPATVPLPDSTAGEPPESVT